jgi:hypothetical protein
LDKPEVTAIVSILLALIGIAIIAEIVSGKSQTGNVLTTGGNVITNMICTALRPLGVQCGTQGYATSTIKYGQIS